MFNNNGESQMKVKEHDVWLVIERNFWSHDNDNWYNVKEQANTKQKADSYKSALDTLNEESKISYFIVQVKGLARIEKESEETNDSF
tara:strand:+ start:135 stop:395 length:261 start_codon:yes stop_codon:yes gene_type:complete